MKTRLSISAAVLLLLLGFALGGPGCSPKKDKNSLKIGFVGEVKNLIPILADSFESREAADLSFRGFYRWNDKWEKEPLMVTEIPSPADGTARFAGKYVVKLKYSIKKNVKWSDGTLLDGRDFLYTYQMLYNPLYSKENQDVVKAVKKLKLDSVLNMEIALTPDSRDLNLFPLSEKALSEVLISTPDDEKNEAFVKKALVNGPFVIKSYKPKLLVYKKNPHYFKAAKASGLEVHFFRDTVAMEEALDKGKIDVAFGMPFKEALKVSSKKGLKGSFVSTSTQKVLTCNFDNPVLADKNFRLFLFSIIDQKAVSKKIFDREDFASFSWLSSRHPAYIDALSEKKVAFEYIDQTLKKAKYEKKSGKAFLHGKEAKLNVLISSKDKDAYAAVLEIKENLDRYGIELDIKAYPPDVYREYLLKKDFDLAVTDLETGPGVIPKFILAPAGIPSDKNGNSGYNYGAWNNPKAVKLCGLYDSELDTAKRNEVLKRLQKQFAYEIPFIPLFSVPDTAVYKSNVEGISLRGYGTRTWNAEQWQKK